MCDEQATCHTDWHSYMYEWLSFAKWHTHEALLLLAGIWPTEAQISESAVMSSRYGTIEPPVILNAGLLDQDCNAQYSEDFSRKLILAGRRLNLIREKWIRSQHTETMYPPSYFIQWAVENDIIPCWLDIWHKQLASPLQDKKRSDLRFKSDTKQWTLKKPERIADPLTTMIYDVLKAAHTAAEPCPRARDVIERIRDNKPVDFIGLAGDEIKFLNSDGSPDTTNIDAVRSRIERMTGRKSGR